MTRKPSGAGVGDQVINHWSEAWCFAKEFGLEFVHNPLRRNEFHSPDVDWESFFELGRDETPLTTIQARRNLRWEKVEPCDLSDPVNWQSLSRRAREAANEGGVVLDLGCHFWCIPIDQRARLPTVYRRKYWAARQKTPIKSTLPRDRFTLAVHVRRSDVKPGMYRYVGDEFYMRTLSALTDALPSDASIHVFSDADEKELAFLREAHSGIVLRLDDDPRLVFHDMVCADALLIGQSFFSVLAGKISTGIKLIDRDLDVPGSRLWLPNQAEDPSWLHVGADGSALEASKVALEQAKTLSRRLLRG